MRSSLGLRINKRLTMMLPGARLASITTGMSTRVARPFPTSPRPRGIASVGRSNTAIRRRFGESATIGATVGRLRRRDPASLLIDLPSTRSVALVLGRCAPMTAWGRLRARKLKWTDSRVRTAGGQLRIPKAKMTTAPHRRPFAVAKREKELGLTVTAPVV